MATVINGKEIAARIIEDLKTLRRPDKILAAVLIGENPQSKSFLKQKELMAKELGVPFELFRFGEEILEDDLIAEIKKIGEDTEIGGIIVQLPLPKHYDRDKILSAINPKQDVDALTAESKKFVNPLPVEVIKDIIRDANMRMHANDANSENVVKEYLKNKAVAVVGKGFLVGKPIIEWLKGNPSAGSGQKCQTLLIFDSKSDLKNLKKADLVITGVGKANLIKPEMLKSGAGVIDFGYDLIEVKSEKGKVESKITGDFDAFELELSTFNFQLSWYTPTPGGTGPILVAEIFKNFYKLNQ